MGLQQVVMRPSLLHQLLFSLFMTLTIILTVYGKQPPPPPLPPATSPSQQSNGPSSFFGKSPSLSSIGSHLLPSFSTQSIKNNNGKNTSLSITDISSSSTSSSLADNKTFDVLFHTCQQIFEMMIFMCLLSPKSYDMVLQALSEIRGEQYRFERIIQYLCSFQLHDDTNNITKKMNPLVWELKAAALSFFNAIVNTSENMDIRCSLRIELDRRGFDTYLKVRRK